MRVDPFDPLAQSRLVTVSGPRTFTSPAPGWNELVNENPQRLWLLLSAFTSGAIARVFPVELFADGGITAQTPGTFVLITAAEYPGLCQGAWQYYDGGTNEWTVYEGWANSP